MWQKKSHYNHHLTKVINHTHNQIHTTQTSTDNSTLPNTSSQLSIDSQPPQIDIQTQNSWAQATAAEDDCWDTINTL